MWHCKSFSSVLCYLFSGVYRIPSCPLLIMMLFYKRIVLVSLICTSFRNGLFFAISAFCRFCWACVLSRPIWCPALSTSVIFWLLLLVFGFFLFFPDRVCPSIFVCTVVLVRVLFPFHRSNCLNQLIGRTCVHVSRLLLFRPSCHFFEFSSLVHSRLLICRLQIRTLMQTILLVLHSRIPVLSTYSILVHTSSAGSCFSLVFPKKSALLWNLFRSRIKCNRNSEYN